MEKKLTPEEIAKAVRDVRNQARPGEKTQATFITGDVVSGKPQDGEDD